MTSTLKSALIIAGPNGAGKTTFAREFLPVEAGFLSFVNADLIAVGLSPFDPDRAAIRAGRLMLETIRDHVQHGTSFAFETTLSGRGYARSIPRWQDLGYQVEMMFLALPSPEDAIARVAQRVRQGGHSIPDEPFAAGSQLAGRTSSRSTDPWSITGPCMTTRAMCPY